MPVSIYLISCSTSTKPHNNKEFANISELKKYEGIYINKGDPSEFLSQKLWTYAPELWQSGYVKKLRKAFPLKPITATRNVEFNRIVHGNIKFIKVEVVNNKAIVKAVSKNNCYLFKKTYYENIDFSIKNGRIILNQPKGNSIVVGLNTNERALGLDADGNGKFKQSGASVGLAYMIFPVAVGGSTEIKFRKSKMLHNINECK